MLHLKYRFLILLAFISLLPLEVFGQGAEKILSFDSRIKVNQDSSLTVTENIRVRAEGQSIKRGIYRDFPARYKDFYGNNYNVGFELLKVERDGNNEPHHTEKLSNGIRIYAGKQNTLIQPGNYTYTFTYNVTRELGFFPDHDELYWSVTGNGWNFVIEETSAIVELPQGFENRRLATDAYTGPQGAQGKNFTKMLDANGNPIFRTTSPLAPHEGLTIVVGFPKGLVSEPTALEKFEYLLKDNLNILSGIVGTILVLLYFFFTWRNFGKDPAMGTIIPLYAPPSGFSPADVRFVSQMGYDQKVFTAAILNMAIKGYLFIEEEDGTYTLKVNKADQIVLRSEERKMAEKLFSGSSEITLERSNYAKIQEARSAHKSHLKLNYEKNYFRANTKYFVGGLLLSILVLLITGSLCLGSSGEVMFMTVWLSFWSIGVFVLLHSVIHAWREALSRHDSASKFGTAISLTLFSLPFVAGEIAGLVVLANMGSVFIIFLLLILTALNALFYNLLKSPTLAGRKIMDQIDGFKMYLSVAEEESLKYMGAPNKTPEVFEKFLPYALALGVEQKWAEQFSGILSGAAASESYSPSWYHGSGWATLGAAGFASTMGSSFSNAISSAATAPGSSSGGGGGGSSGGGGGGGGGGGW